MASTLQHGVTKKRLTYPPGDLGMATLFFTAVTCYLNSTEEDRDEYYQLYIATVTTPSPVRALHEISEIVFMNW